MLPPLPRLSDYDVSPHNGFLPGEIPLDVLPDRYYQPWETIVRNFQSLILAKRLRRIVDTLPVLSTDFLLTEAEWRRAYSILVFIAHGYIWGGERPADVSHHRIHVMVGTGLIILHRLFHHPSQFHSCRHVNTWNSHPSPRILPSAYGIGGPCSMESRLTRWTTFRQT